MSKTLFSLHNLIILLFAGFFALMSCEGPKGPEGPQGPQGPAGPSGAEQCGVCHNSTSELVAKEVQWATSAHATGLNFERSTKDCAPCHTSQGFIEVLETGELATVADVQNPVGQNCRTCHKIHTSYDSTDWALRKTTSTKLQLTGEIVDFKTGNTCAQCHQARTAVRPDLTQETFAITNARWGPHHSTAANMLAASGAVEIPGSKTYTNTGHLQAISKGCVSCHMAQAFGAQAGGHTMNMSYDSHGSEVDNVVACTGCHSGLKKFDDKGQIITNTLVKLTDLRNRLAAAGILDTTASHGVYSSDLFKPGTYSAKLAAAGWNYLLIASDGSKGVHNPAYINAVLQNSIEAISQ
ncbi:MAG TPA: hypothetical protein PLC04_01195 [Candidatus Kapabacteria bacterium]|jgi:hypothetical protein|nr:hypothetical protein [Candidatus Kapabacteria bacterium]HOV91681.1 hypothetical protein [Candidatus Kapabacteria bacterium]